MSKCEFESHNQNMDNVDSFECLNVDSCYLLTSFIPNLLIIVCKIVEMGL